MDGLIGQAKDQLWNMVSLLTNVRCGGNIPDIQVALYEYGRPTNLESNGYIKQISPFTRDLDFLFMQLKDLSTGGGEEYCGQVLYNSLTQLKWDSSSLSYKTVFIAGNENFLQGSISYKTACGIAKEKGVFINTIYCGDRSIGLKENWELAAVCGNGVFTTISQDSKDIIIPTPYDSAIIALKKSFNNTYTPYEETGISGFAAMNNYDTSAIYNLSDPSKISSYNVVKTNTSLFDYSGWDLVDAFDKDSSIIKNVNMGFLSDSLKNMSREKLSAIKLPKRLMS